jgi:hypothetical protein
MRNTVPSENAGALTSGELFNQILRAVYQSDNEALRHLLPLVTREQLQDYLLLMSVVSGYNLSQDPRYQEPYSDSPGAIFRRCIDESGAILSTLINSGDPAAAARQNAVVRQAFLNYLVNVAPIWLTPATSGHARLLEPYHDFTGESEVTEAFLADSSQEWQEFLRKFIEGLTDTQRSLFIVPIRAQQEGEPRSGIEDLLSFEEILEVQKAQYDQTLRTVQSEFEQISRLLQSQPTAQAGEEKESTPETKEEVVLLETKEDEEDEKGEERGQTIASVLHQTQRIETISKESYNSDEGETEFKQTEREPGLSPARPAAVSFFEHCCCYIL